MGSSLFRDKAGRKTGRLWLPQGKDCALVLYTGFLQTAFYWDARLLSAALRADASRAFGRDKAAMTRLTNVTLCVSPNKAVKTAKHLPNVLVGYRSPYPSVVNVTPV